MSAWQFAKAQNIAEQRGWAKFSTMQNHYNLVYREEEREMIPLCIDQKVGLIPWSPLARGFLAGTRSQSDLPASATTPNGSDNTRAKTDTFAHTLYYQPSDFTIVDRVSSIAKNLSVKPAQVALAWLLSKSAVTSPIIGASKMWQLEEAVAGVNIKLSEKDIQQLEELYVPHRILGHTP